MFIQPRFQARIELIEAQISKDVCCFCELSLRHRTDTMYCMIVLLDLLRQNKGNCCTPRRVAVSFILLGAIACYKLIGDFVIRR